MDWEASSRSDVVLDHVPVELCKLASASRKGGRPSPKNQIDNIDGDEVQREQGEHHDCPFDLYCQSDIWTVLSRRLLDGLDDGSRLLLNVGDKMEETAGDAASHSQIADSVDEGELEVHHQTDWSLENFQLHGAGDVFNERDQALVDVGVLSSHKAV